MSFDALISQLKTETKLNEAKCIANVRFSFDDVRKSNRFFQALARKLQVESSLDN